jgi:uncharacterized protein YrzB (UPF0473 family)
VERGVIMAEKDYVTVQDDQGNEKVFQVDALFDMEGESYAMLTSGEETMVMKVEDENGSQSLVSATDEEIENLMDAYNIAIDADIDEPENFQG